MVANLFRKAYQLFVLAISYGSLAVPTLSTRTSENKASTIDYVFFRLALLRNPADLYRSISLAVLQNGCPYMVLGNGFMIQLLLN